MELRLIHPAIDFWVDVRLRRFAGAWLAVADLASAHEVAVVSRPASPSFLAVWPLGAALARRLVANAVLPR